MSDPIKSPNEDPSRVESILSDTIGLEGYTIETPPRSRIEILLIELKELIEEGGSSTDYATSLLIEMDENFVMTATLKNKDGDALGSPQVVDLPLESVVVDGSYNDQTKKVVLTLQNGNTVEFSVADLVSGLQTEITSNNKLNADLVDDSTSTNKFVTSADKTAWNGKQDALTFDDSPTQNSTNPVKSGGVYTALSGKADTADIPVAGTATPVMDGTGSAGSAMTWSKSDHVHPSDTSKQDALTTAQLAAVNSGIDSTKVGQIATNTSNILSKCVVGDCETISSTAAKVVTISGDFVLQKGCLIAVKFKYTNNVTDTENTPITLNVNNTGAYRIWYRNGDYLNTTQGKVFGYAGYYVYYMFDGVDRWLWVNYSMDNTYDTMSQPEASAGTAINERLITAKVLNDTILEKADQAPLTGYTVDTAESSITAVTTVQEAVAQFDYRTTINKNNISSVQEQANWNSNSGVKNKLNYTGFYNNVNGAGVSPFTTKNVTYKKNADDTISAYTTNAGASGNAFCYLCDDNGTINFKQYFDGKHILSCDVYSANHYVLFYKIDNETSVAVNGETLLPNRNNITNAYIILQVYSGEIISKSTPIIFNPMIRLSSISDSTYQPHAMSNVELTTEIETDEAALIELVDGGAKNFAIPNHITGEPSDITVVQDDKGHFEISGTTGSSQMTLNLFNQNPAIDLPYGAHISAASSISGISYKARWYNSEGEENYTTIGSTDLELPANSKLRSLYVQANANTQVSFAINQMVCTKAAWDISQTYQPYRPSYQELYERVVALEQANQ